MRNVETYRNRLDLSGNELKFNNFLDVFLPLIFLIPSFHFHKEGLCVFQTVFSKQIYFLGSNCPSRCTSTSNRASTQLCMNQPTNLNKVILYVIRAFVFTITYRRIHIYSIIWNWIFQDISYTAFSTE